MNAITEKHLVLVKSQLVNKNPAAVYITSLPAETGKRSQAQALRVIARMLNTDIDHLNWGALRSQHTAALRAKIVHVYSPATANKMLSALRQTLKQAWLLGQMTAEEYNHAVELESVIGEAKPVGRELSTSEIRALMNACQEDHTPAGIRDAAIIGIMYAAGLRRDEVVRLGLTDLDPEIGMLVIHGKRNKQRTAYITNGAADALKDWLVIRGPVAGAALFVEVNKGGKILIKREEMLVKPFRKIGGVDVPNKKAGQTIYRGGAMTSQAIYNMLYKRAQQAGIENFSPHDLRRTFISHLLDAGVDIVTVSKMAGHANIQTTARYDRRPEEAKKKAAELLHVPYKTAKA